MTDPSREAFEAYVRRAEGYADDANFVQMASGEGKTEYRSRLIECDWQRWQAAVAWATQRERESVERRLTSAMVNACVVGEGQDFRDGFTEGIGHALELLLPREGKD